MRLLRREDGFTLLEAVIALGLIVAAVSTAITALANHSIATRSLDAGNIALNLARNQIEHVKNDPFNTNNCYSRTVTYPSAEYTVTVTVVQEQPTPPASPPTLQIVTVKALRGSKEHMSVQIYKANLSGATVNQTCTS